jgi:NTP pyrophosphatase (non-canonical NTP hydrolase)
MTGSSDSLRSLAQSTRAFYQRFDVEPVLADTIQNFQEEVRELIEAAQSKSDTHHIAEETADVFVTAIGICFAVGVDVDQLIEQVYKVIAKNDAKTHATHTYANGKIRRRSTSNPQHGAAS